MTEKKKQKNRFSESFYPQTLQEAFGFLKKTPEGQDCVFLLAFWDSTERYHVTLISTPVGTFNLSFYYRLSRYIQRNLGKVDKVEYDGEAAFKSRIHPHAKIMKIKNIVPKTIAQLIEQVMNFEFKPHITFKSGKEEDLTFNDVRLSLAYYERPDEMFPPSPPLIKSQERVLGLQEGALMLNRAEE